MLINLSNHPLAQWSEKQIQEANKLFGEIVDLPFPQIDPQIDSNEIVEIAKEYLKKIEQIAKDKNENVVVHIMGELTFCFALIQLLKQKGIKCVASTTQRNVIEQEAGKKTLLFNFVRFRDYF